MAVPTFKDSTLQTSVNAIDSTVLTKKGEVDDFDFDVTALEGYLVENKVRAVFDYETKVVVLTQKVHLSWNSPNVIMHVPTDTSGNAFDITTFNNADAKMKKLVFPDIEKFVTALGVEINS